MKNRVSKKALISVCTLIALLLALTIWTIWSNTALTLNMMTVSSNRTLTIQDFVSMLNLYFYDFGARLTA